MAKAQYTFDCFVCEERYEGNDLARLLAFMEPHAKCGDGTDASEEADRG